MQVGDVPTDVTAGTLLPAGITAVRFRFRDASGNVGEAVAALIVTAPAGGVVVTADVAVWATNAEGLSQPVTAAFARVIQAGLLTAFEIAPPAPAPPGTMFTTAVLDVGPRRADRGVRYGRCVDPAAPPAAIHRRGLGGRHDSEEPGPRVCHRHRTRAARGS
jgi:hypothetical protein